MVSLFVRVQPKKGEKFFRCGMEFIRAWRKVDVDEATARRLLAEQMLEVTDKQPADYEEPQADAEAAAKVEADARAEADAKAKADAEAKATADAEAAAKGGKKK